MIQAQDTPTISPAAQLMAIEVISELLVSTSPHQLGEKLSEHLRELTGARTVMILIHTDAHPGIELLHVSPSRRTSMLTPVELGLFSPQQCPGTLPRSPGELPADHPLREPLLREGVHSMARYPLHGVGEAVGLLVLFDIPGLDRVTELNQIIALLAPPMALALKNALAFRMIKLHARELEQRVAKRTAELMLKNSKLEQSERKFSGYIDSSPDGIFVVDELGHHVEVNRAASGITGYSEAELLGMTLLDLVPPDFTATTLHHFQVLKEMGATNAELEFIHKSGSKRWWSIDAVKLSELCYLVFTKDITSRKQVEFALRESERRMHLAIANSPIPIMIHDELDNVLQLSSGWTKFSGYTIEDIPTLADWTERAYGLREGSAKGYIDRLFDIDQTLYDGERMVTAKDGSQRIWDFQTTPLGKVRGGRRELLRMATDVTQRKRAEDERLKMEQQMLHAQKLESLGVLAGGIAHDFNNILTAIVGNADLALMRLSPESPVIDNLHNIEKAAARAADLAKQMLAYSGKGKFVVEPLDMNHLLEEMIHMLEVSISKKAVLRLNLAPSLPQVEADATQMRQIIMNLVINASEAIGEKSGIIAITTGCMDCDRRYLNDIWLAESISEGLYIYLEIADTGCGMDQGTMSRIFDPFFTTKFTGRGLGMAAVLGIIKGHNGAIKIYSEPGKGTTFKILLPALGRPPELFNHEALPRDDWRGDGVVLIVDDEETVRAIGGEMLRELGYLVLTACDGREALEVFSGRDDICLVVLDLTMPHLDGEQTFRELRRINPGVKIIMSSGYNEQEVSQKFVGKGLTGFVQKPYKLSTLREVIKNS